MPKRAKHVTAKDLNCHRVKNKKEQGWTFVKNIGLKRFDFVQSDGFISM